MNMTIEMDNVRRINTKRLISGFRKLVEEREIETVIIYDNTAVEELFVLSELKVEIYSDLGNEQIMTVLRKRGKRIKPVSDLKRKADMIIVPANRDIFYVDMEEERKKLRKKGLVLYRAYTLPERGDLPTVYQTVFPDLAVFTLLVPNKQLMKMYVTRKGTQYIAQEKQMRLKNREIKALLKNTGFKKAGYFDEEFAELAEKGSAGYIYRLFRKGKRVIAPDVEEEDQPLMTSQEISDRFNEVMAKTSLTREDFELK